MVLIFHMCIIGQMSVDLDFTPTAARGGKRYLAEISALSVSAVVPNHVTRFFIINWDVIYGAMQ